MCGGGSGCVGLCSMCDSYGMGRVWGGEGRCGGVVVVVAWLVGV